MTEPVKAVQDECDDWYVIPEGLLKEFNRLHEKIYIHQDNYDVIDDIINEFEEKFGGYRTGGDLNNIQLWAKLG